MNSIFGLLLLRYVLSDLGTTFAALNSSHVISCKGLEVDHSKISAIKQWSVLTNAKRVWSFLEITGNYRLLIKEYTTIAKPFKWGSIEHLAFDTLKGKLSCTPVLGLPYFT
uniref:Secreted protein n=1 Tax=Solanum lycopersicum TaxID=4081 RepID=A0A3Q7IFM9_SOLLC